MLLKRGSTGEAVEELQSALVERGHAIDIDGKFGARTEEAVRKFQTTFKLDVDGIVGPDTLAELNKPFAEVPQIPDVKAPPAGDNKVKNNWPRQSDVSSFYGAVGTRQKTLVLPYPMRIAWNKGQVITKFSVHERVHDSAARVFARIANEYTADQRRDCGIDLFGGCLNVRVMRGGSAYSMHSWGIAIDFDPERNQLKWGRDQARLARPDCERFWRAWEDEGWLSLGRARNFDWMHVQAAKL
jgi:hypothetical protein